MSNTNYYQPKQEQMVEAALHGNLELVHHLIHQEDVDLNGERHGRTALQEVCKEGHYDIAKLLLYYGATLDTLSLLNACHRGHYMIVHLLLKRGANVNSSMANGKSPLHFSCKAGQTLVSELLLQEGANIDAVDVDGNTPLLGCCYSLLRTSPPCHNLRVCMGLLLRGGADVDLRNKKGYTAMNLVNSWKERNPELVQLLKGQTKNTSSSCAICTTRTQQQPQYYHISRQEDGMDAVDQGDYRETHVYPISRQDEMIDAAEQGDDREKVESLLDDEAVDMNGTNEDGWTALQHASYNGHEDMVLLLLRRGADLELRTTKLNFTALMWACEGDHYDTAHILLSHGAKADPSDNNGNTCLHKACFHGHYKLAQLLLKHCVYVNVANRLKETPLHLACGNGDKKLCKLLLRHGAKTDLKDVDGDTPLDVANENGFFIIAKRLLKHNNAGLLTDVGNTNYSVLAEVQQIGNNVSSLDQRLNSKVRALEQRCNTILDRHDTIPTTCSNKKRRKKSKKSKKRRGSEFDQPQAKRAKLDDEKNGMVNLLENCQELQEKASQNNQDFQEALEKMKKKSFRSNMFLGLLAGIYFIKT